MLNNKQDKLEVRHFRLNQNYEETRRQLTKYSTKGWSFNTVQIQNYPSQGWKLHVSADINSATKTLKRVSSILKNRGVLFKIPTALSNLFLLNSGLVNYSQIGKFITIYCRNENEAIELANDLDKATRGLSCPEVPFDFRFKKNSNVFYRYGAFISKNQNNTAYIYDNHGQRHEDLRAPGKAVPKWIKNPFQMLDVQLGTQNQRIGSKYLVFRAIIQRGKGGVYEALDISKRKPRRVIIKEGRRHGETYFDGSDGYQRIKHEKKILQILKRVGIQVPEIYDFFIENKTAYLVLEKIVGRHMIFIDRPYAKLSWVAVQQIKDSLTNLLNAIHSVGLVWRDCKPPNLIKNKNRIRPIDFEGACKVVETDKLPWSTTEYTPKLLHKSFTRPKGTYEDDYAFAVILFQLGTGRLPPSGKQKQLRILRRNGCPKDLSMLIIKKLNVN